MMDACAAKDERTVLARKTSAMTINIKRREKITAGTLIAAVQFATLEGQNFIQAN